MGFWDLLEEVASVGIDLLNKGIEESMRRQEKNLQSYAKKHNLSKEQVSQLREKMHRRTHEEFGADRTGMDCRPEDFSISRGDYLSDAVSSAPGEPGVYILYLYGRVMKCGVASYGQGIRWRFTQYYNLNYDNKARCGDYWSVSPENRDSITVAWQACPPRVCNELEYKLFKKYGKGPWAKRAPVASYTNEWKLLI